MEYNSSSSPPPPPSTPPGNPIDRKNSLGSLEGFEEIERITGEKFKIFELSSSPFPQKSELNEDIRNIEDSCVSRMMRANKREIADHSYRWVFLGIKERFHGITRSRFDLIGVEDKR